MTHRPLASSLPPVNPGTAGSRRGTPAHGAGPRTPERDAKLAGARKSDSDAKGVVRRASGKNSVRHQALAQIATQRRVGARAGSARPMPERTGHAGPTLPAYNMA